MITLLSIYKVDNELVENVKHPETGDHQIKHEVFWQCYSFCAMNGIK